LIFLSQEKKSLCKYIISFKKLKSLIYRIEKILFWLIKKMFDFLKKKKERKVDLLLNHDYVIFICMYVYTHIICLARALSRACEVNMFDSVIIIN
jgi:hypothetical protein